MLTQNNLAKNISRLYTNPATQMEPEILAGALVRFFELLIEIEENLNE